MLMCTGNLQERDMWHVTFQNQFGHLVLWQVLIVGYEGFHHALWCDCIVLDHLLVFISLTMLPNSQRNVVFISVLKCMKERFNKFLLIWTKFHSVDTETRGYSLYGEIYDSLATILLPVTSLTMCRWHLSLESLTDRIMIFRPSLWIREVISVNVITWNLRGENLRWLRNFSMLGKVMKLLNWKWLHLSL